MEILWALTPNNDAGLAPVNAGKCHICYVISYKYLLKLVFHQMINHLDVVVT